MNINPRMRRLTDILMTLALLFLMGYQLWGEAAHEWVGTAMGVLFIVHQWFNRRWYRTLRHGPWSLMRFFHAGVDLLAALAMLALLTSGAVLLPKGHTASHVFSFVRLTDYIGTAQIVHLAASHWLYILLALHIGFHGRLFCDQFLPKRVRAAKPKRTWARYFSARSLHFTVQPPLWREIFWKYCSCASIFFSLMEQNPWDVFISIIWRSWSASLSWPMVSSAWRAEYAWAEGE